MAYKSKFNCLHFRLFVVGLLLFQFSFSQNFTKVNNWLDDNIKDLGGRAVILVY